MVYKVTLKHPKRTLYAFLSRLDPENNGVLLLERNEPGLIGKDGTLYPIERFESAYLESSLNPGVYDGENEVENWRRTLRTA